MLLTSFKVNIYEMWQWTIKIFIDITFLDTKKWAHRKNNPTNIKKAKIQNFHEWQRTKGLKWNSIKLKVQFYLIVLSKQIVADARDILHIR